jgi:hypothetical protein
MARTGRDWTIHQYRGDRRAVAGYSGTRGARADGHHRVASAVGSGGTLAQLIARQPAAFDAEWHNADRYRSASGVPIDMINFLYDTVACAIGAGWRDGVRVEMLPVVYKICEDQLVQQLGRGSKPLPVVTGLDGLALEGEWVRRVGRATFESVVA